MESELQFVCYLWPTYVKVAIVVLFASAISSCISVLVACVRRLTGGTSSRKHVNAFHSMVAIASLLYFALLGFEFFVARRHIRDYELQTRKPAPTVRAALRQEARFFSLLGSGGIILGLTSLTAWRFALSGTRRS
jgi:phosphatidylglycerophosphate synthase